MLFDFSTFSLSLSRSNPVAANLPVRCPLVPQRPGRGQYHRVFPCARRIVNPKVSSRRARQNRSGKQASLHRAASKVSSTHTLCLCGCCTHCTDLNLAKALPLTPMPAQPTHAAHQNSLTNHPACPTKQAVAAGNLDSSALKSASGS